MQSAVSRLVSVLALATALAAGCGSSTQRLSVSKVERAYRASGLRPIANIAVKTPKSWLGDFYIGDPEPAAHVTIFKTEQDAQRATGSGVWRTVRRRNVVVTFFIGDSRVQARIEHVLDRLVARP